MKKAYISQWQRMMLIVFQEVSNIAREITGERQIDVEQIFYSMAFQGGFDKFLIYGEGKDDDRLSDFISARSEYLGSDFNEKENSAIFSVFSELLCENEGNVAYISIITSLQHFLADLLSAMRTGSSLVKVGRMPKEEEIETILPPELFIPIKFLLDSIQMERVALPHVAAVFDRSDIERLREILVSPLFLDYSGKQSLLDIGDEKPKAILRELTGYTDRFRKMSGGLLTAGASNVGLLTVTQKMIDAAFGKFPGTLAGVAAKLGSDFLEKRRRVVVYSYKSAVYELLRDDIRRFSEI